MIMQAVVIEVQWGRLLVLDLDTRQNVLVNTQDARRFRPGDLIRIRYNGAMTKSIPPQITAIQIGWLSQGGFPPVLPPIVFPPVVRPPFGCPGCRPPLRPGPRPWA